jgi:HPt (histidine-containing phosphotransfer) domain-containing protein
MIDRARLEELHQDIGEDLGEVIELFLVEADEVIERLAAAEAPDERGALLHMIKGAALNLGFSGIAEIAEEAEAAEAPGANRPWPEVVADLRATLEASRAQLGPPEAQVAAAG